MYRLTYWKKRGRAEQIRLLLNELGEAYEDVHVSRGPEFQALQHRGPGVLAFGAIPLLEDGAFRLVQGPVILGYLARKHGLLPDDLQTQARADAIALGAEDLRIHYFTLFGPDAAAAQKQFVEGPWSERWRPRLDGLLELNGDTGFFVGNSVTHADFAVWEVLDCLQTWVAGVTLDGAPRLQRFFDAIRERPRIAAYLKSDRRVHS